MGAFLVKQNKMGGLQLMARMKSGVARVFVSTACLGLLASGSRAEDPGDFGFGPDTSASKVRAPMHLELTAGREIVAELDQMGLFQPTRAFYAGHMGKIYTAAMAVVSRKQQYMKLGDEHTYLDPTTEAHESLHERKRDRSDIATSGDFSACPYCQ
jgi:hypothetical protein